jgi:hypothetical protein
MHTTAEFALTRQDFLRFQRFSGRRLTAHAGARMTRAIVKIVVWLLLASSLFIAFRAAERHRADAPAMYLMAALFVTALLLIQMLPHFVAASLRGRLIADGGAFLRPRSLQFTDSALTTTWATGRSEHQWSNFIARADDAANHYLLIDACAAIIVPREAVAAFAGEFERYVAQIPRA